MQGSQAECALNYLDVHGTTIKAALPHLLYLIQLILTSHCGQHLGEKMSSPHVQLQMPREHEHKRKI